MEGRLSDVLTGRFPVITVTSPIPAWSVADRIHQCLRTQDALRRQGTLWDRVSRYGETRVVARRRGDELVLALRNGNRNSWRAQSVVEIVPLATGGSQVRLHPSSSVFTSVFMVLWLAFVATFAVVGVRSAGGAASVIPFGMLAFGIGLSLFGRRMARAELDELREWLARCLDGQ